MSGRLFAPDILEVDLGDAHHEQVVGTTSCVVPVTVFEELHVDLGFGVVQGDCDLGPASLPDEEAGS